MADLGNIGFSIGGNNQAYQYMWSGTGSISGTLTETGVSVLARLYLYDEKWNQLIGWQEATGSYTFSGLATSQKFTVVAENYAASGYNRQIFKGITPA